MMVSSLLADKLQLPGVQLDRAHRVGQRRDDRPRPIVTRFSRFCDCETAMRNAKKLCGTNIYFNDDLCAASQAIKDAQMPQMKQVRAQGKITFFRHTKLIVKDRHCEEKSSVAQHSYVNKAPSTSDHDQQRDDAVAGGTLAGGAAVARGSAQSGGCSKEQTFRALFRLPRDRHHIQKLGVLRPFNIHRR